MVVHMIDTKLRNLIGRTAADVCKDTKARVRSVLKGDWEEYSWSTTYAQKSFWSAVLAIADTPVVIDIHNRVSVCLVKQEKSNHV
jgi:hypothetical protein